MNFKRLQTFIQVVDKQSFSEVAEMLNITQSGVSRQIKALEDEVGIQLLNRNTSYVELTAAGRLVYRKAKSLLEQWEQLTQECQSMKKELSGILKIGASTIPATYLLPRILKSFQEKYPRVEFCITTKDSSQVLSKLEQQQIDIAMVGSKPQSTYLESRYIAEDRLVLIGSDPNQCIASLEEIIHQPLIIREKGSGTRDAMDKALEQYGMNPADLHYLAEVGSTESVLALVEAGVGISFVSHWAISETTREKIRVLYELPTDRHFFLTWHKKRQSYPLIQAFSQEAMRVYTDHRNA